MPAPGTEFPARGRLNASNRGYELADEKGE